MKKKKKVVTNNSIVNDFVEPISYFKSDFGREREAVKVYILNIKASQLFNDFKIFEDMNNVEAWPVSTLIQRELDHNRAENIAKDYLLQDHDLKFFPSLTAVLIPTDEQYQALDSYEGVSDASLNSFINKQVRGVGKYVDNDFEDALEIVAGLYEVPFDDTQGDISWDKHKLTAVIIDGQHRFKSLESAAQKDKSFLNAKLTVTLIDLTESSKTTSTPPTQLSRDLFVTINHTPEQISEARLCLMDDKDTLSTFTQVLVDDAEQSFLPAIQPELVDWDCEGGKHKAESSLSGVLVLRQIINTAMFDDIRLGCIEDRQNKKLVTKWRNKVDSWFDIDELIKNEIGESDTLKTRFEVADLNNDGDDSDEEGLFLFSFSNKVSKLLKLRFKELYLSSFRTVFSSLEPYKILVNIAKTNGVLDDGKDINNYYRAFKGKRAKLLSEKIGLRGEVEKYESEMKESVKYGLLYTVMGQKAVFTTLFKNFLHTTNICESDIKKSTENFVEDFNKVFIELSKEDSFDKYFFSTELQVAGCKKSRAYGGVGSSFWKGIVIKLNNELDYSKVAIKHLSTVIHDLIRCNNNGEPFKFSDQNGLINRHKTYLRKLEISEDENELKKIACEIVSSKETAINKLLGY